MDEKRKVMTAMLESLINSFQLADDTGMLIFSGNYGDIADMLYYFKVEVSK